MYFDTPRSYIGAVYERLLYGDQPLGRDIIGSKDTVRAATRETFTTFLDTWYQPERTVIGIGGQLGDDLLGRLDDLFGGVAARPTGAFDPVSLPTDASPVSVFTKQSDQAHLILGARGYPIGHPDRYAVQLMSTVLGGGMSSRLFTEVRERRGLAYYVFAAASGYIDAGSVSAQAGVDITRIDDAIATIRDELRRIADEPVPSAELEKARNFCKGRFVLGLESPYGTIMYGLRREVLEGQVYEPEEVVAGLDAVTGDDVQRVAQAILGGRLHLAVIGPFEDSERFEALVS